MVHCAHAHLCQVHSPWIPAASFWQLTPPYGTSTSAFLHGVYLDLYKSIKTTKKVGKSMIIFENDCWSNPSPSHCECVFPPFDQVSRAMLLKEQRTDGDAMTSGPLRHQSRASSKTPNIIINLKFHFHDGGVSFGWKINAVMIISHFSPLHILSNYYKKWFHHQFSVSWNLGKYEEQHLKRKRPSSSPAVCPH